MANDADNGPADDDGDSPDFDGSHDIPDTDASVEDDDSAAVGEALDEFQLEPAEDDAVEELFTEVEAPDIDGEELWEEVLADPEAATNKPEPGATTVDEEPTTVDEEPTTVDAGETVVPKEQFCQRCEHFAAPPELACDHPGTEIADVVDSKQFRVVDCPIVARREHAESVFPDE